jgi:hypothetical protein
LNLLYEVNAMLDYFPHPDRMYYSTATITNNTEKIWALNRETALEVYLWIYINNSKAEFQTYEYYERVLREWEIFKFEMTTPNSTVVPLADYSTITDFAGSDNYHFPDAANMHVLPPASLDGDYYAKATVPVSADIVLQPGESMSFKWWFGMAWEANNGTIGMYSDLNFVMQFDVAAPSLPATEEPTEAATTEPTEETTTDPTEEATAETTEPTATVTPSETAAPVPPNPEKTGETTPPVVPPEVTPTEKPTPTPELTPDADAAGQPPAVTAGGVSTAAGFKGCGVALLLIFSGLALLIPTIRRGKAATPQER